MGEFIEALISNPFLVILIIGGVLKFLFGDSEQGEKQKNPTTVRPKKHPLGKLDPKPEAKPKPKTVPVFAEQQENEAPLNNEIDLEQLDDLSIEEQQQLQLEQYAKKMNTDVDISYDKLEDLEIGNIEQLFKERKQQANQQKEFKKQMKGQLTKKGLVEGIIMSEVLGPPRALKRYKPISERRKQL